MDAASAHLARLGATSRPSGSAAATEARQYCAGVLEAMGFAVVERPFEYSKFPGAYATPVAGALVPCSRSVCCAPSHSRVYSAACSSPSVHRMVFRYWAGGRARSPPFRRRA